MINFAIRINRIMFFGQKINGYVGYSDPSHLIGCRYLQSSSTDLPGAAERNVPWKILYNGHINVHGFTLTWQ